MINLDIKDKFMGKTENQNVGHLRCLLCGSGRNHPIYKESGIDILRCCECRHVFSSYAANPHYDEYWGHEVAEDEHYYWNKARARMHQDFFRRFLVGRSGRLLDMGCGLGFFLKAMATYGNWEGYGCEISTAAVRYARETLGIPNIICSRLETADLPQSSFDLITMWDVLEHLLQPDPLIRRCHSLLKQGGICFIYTPNVNIQLPRARFMKLLRFMAMQSSGSYMQARDHLHHYSMSTIRRLLERNGFSRVEFLHLHPIQSISHSKSVFLRGGKNLWYETAHALAVITKDRLNFDNLFVLGHK